MSLSKKVKFNINKKYLAVFAYLIASLSGALGQFCFKHFSNEINTSSKIGIIFNLTLWIAIFLYFLVMVLFIIGFRLGGELSTLYTVYGTTFIWALILAVVYLGENISVTNISGIILIILGITFLNIGPIKQKAKKYEN